MSGLNMSLRTGVESCFVHRKSAQLGSSNMKSLTKQDPSGELSGRPSGPMLTFQKSDLWLAESALSSEGVRGAVGFRKMKDSAVFATHRRGSVYDPKGRPQKMPNG
jgi:hypothetical protein